MRGDLHAGVAQLLAHPRGLVVLEQHDVGLDRGAGRSSTPGELAQPLGQHARVRVVLGQPLDVVVERVQAPAAATMPDWRIAPPSICL